MFDYTAIADRLRTVSWRTDVVNRFTGPTLPFPVKQKDGQKMFDYTAIADRLRTVSWRTDVVNRFTGPTLPVKSKNSTFGNQLQVSANLFISPLPVKPGGL